VTSWRGWLAMLGVWAALVVLFFVFAGSRAGFAALIGGVAGALIALVAIRFGRHGPSDRRPD
jgi:hypothetical protein